MGRSTRSPFWAVLAILPGLACQGKIQPQECARMLDRYIDMVALADPSTVNLPPEQASLLRETKKAFQKTDARYAQVETRCEAEVTRKEYDCAMAAKNANEWEACIE